MFVLKNLIKKINENYYRNYQDTVMTPVDENVSQHCIAIHKQIAKEDGEMLCMLEDLFMLTKVDNDDICISEYGKELRQREYDAVNKVEKAIKNKLTPETHELINILKTKFVQDSFIVGGFVRDAIASRKSNDIDFCTSIPYNKLKTEFRKNGWGTKDTGKQFLVLNVTHPLTKENFEIAALRKDKDNNGAKVGTIEEDSQRRDFVNSCIYFSIKEEKLIDPSGMAIQDCQENRLRFMGKAKDRLNEDNLRGWRFYKFVSRGWEPDQKSLKAVRESWDSIYKNSNSERVRRELESIIAL